MTEQERRSQGSVSRLRRPGKTALPTIRRTLSSNMLGAPPKGAVVSSKVPEDEPWRQRRPRAERTMPEPDEGDRRTGTGEVLEDTQTKDGADNVEEGDGHTGDSESFVRAARIAALEQALVAAQAELQTQFELVKRLRRNQDAYVNAIDTYKQDLVKARDGTGGLDLSNSDLEHETEDHRSSGHERSATHQQVRELNGQSAEMRPDVHACNCRWREELDRERTERVRERSHHWEQLNASRTEAEGRYKQLLGLKQSVSTLTRVEGQVADTDLADRMDQICHRTREWVINNFRRSKLDFVGIGASTEEVLRAVAPAFPNIEPAARLAVYQTVLMHRLMPIFEDDCLFGMRRDGHLGRVREVAGLMEAIMRPTDFARWHAMTFQTISRGYRDILAENTKLLIDDLVEDVDRLLCDITGGESSEERRRALADIIESVVLLARTLRMQVSLYSVEKPANPASVVVKFEDAKMENLNPGEDADAQAPHVQFVTFPALIKTAGEEGGGTRTVVYRSKVWCAS